MDKHPVSHTIRNTDPFYRDSFDIMIQHSQTLIVKWNFPAGIIQRTEAVLFEDAQDMVKEISLLMTKGNEKFVYKAHTNLYKGELKFHPAAGDAEYRAEFRVYNSLNVCLKWAETPHVFMKENEGKQMKGFSRFEPCGNWSEQFSAYTSYPAEDKRL